MNEIMEERCGNCMYCAELYTPPTKDTQPKYEFCCTLFSEERKVMSLGSNIESMCECFTPKKEVLNR